MRLTKRGDWAVKQDSAGLITAALVGLLVGVGYLHYAAPACMEWCETTHAGILDGTALAPYRFRLLGAWVAEAMPGGVAFQYASAHLLVMPAAFVAIFAWLRGEVGKTRALTGVWVMAACFLVFYYMGTFGLNSQIEMLLLASGLIYLRQRGVDAGYAALVVLGTFNRETTGLLLVIAVWVSGRPIQTHRPARNIGVLAAFAAVFLSLRLVLGSGTGSESVLDIVRGNLNPMRLTLALLHHVPLIAVVAMGWRSRPTGDRAVIRWLAAAAVYAPMVLVFGYWDEVRLWEPLVMLALPLAVGRDHEFD